MTNKIKIIGKNKKHLIDKDVVWGLPLIFFIMFFVFIFLSLIDRRFLFEPPLILNMAFIFLLKRIGLNRNKKKKLITQAVTEIVYNLR